MGRGSSSSKRGGEDNEEAAERKRLKRVAFENQSLSDAPAKCSTPLRPSKQVVKHHGSDIVRKSQRKNRFLFTFPALLAPVSGGKIGELDRLSTKNPVLYLDFPQGRMKLFGTIIYPKNRYLTLQFSRGKNAVCEDYFDNMIVFSEAWWIGTKEENPEEARLEFPKELTEGQQMEFDFKGGAGAASVNKQEVPEAGNKHVEKESSEPEFDIDLSDEEESLENKIQVTPVRQSERNAGKKFNYTEMSPDDASGGSDSNASEEDDEKVQIKPDSSTGNDKQVQTSSTPETKTQKIPQTSSSLRKEKSNGGDGLVVQATLSTLFKKVEEKATGNSKKNSSSKASRKTS